MLSSYSAKEKSNLYSHLTETNQKPPNKATHLFWSDPISIWGILSIRCFITQCQCRARSDNPEESTVTVSETAQNLSRHSQQYKTWEQTKELQCYPCRGYTRLSYFKQEKKQNPITCISYVLYLVLHNKDSTTDSLKIPHQQVELQQPKPTNPCTKSTMSRFQQNYIHGWKGGGRNEPPLCLHVSYPGSDILITDRNGYSVYHQWRETDTPTAQLMTS